MQSHTFVAMIAVSLASLSAPAAAADPVLQAIQLDQEYIRYDQGVPTIDREGRYGAVQIQPLPREHGSLVFAVTVFNAARVPANIDIANIAVDNGTDAIDVMDVNRLLKKAKNRTFWSQFGVALLGGLASGAAASQRDTYNSSLYTPYGSYHGYYSAPSIAGQFQAARIADSTAMTLGVMQARLDATRDALSDQVMQMSTVDPGEAYAGKVVLEKFKARKLPQQLTIVVDWNGEQYPFAFQLAKAGTAAPSYTHVVRAERASSPAVSSPVRRSLRGNPVLPEAEMASLIERVAHAMPAGFELESGTKLSGYQASGTALEITADADPSALRDPTNWQVSALDEICSTRAFEAILLQGGEVRATYRKPGKKEMGIIEASDETCV